MNNVTLIIIVQNHCIYTKLLYKIEILLAFLCNNDHDMLHFVVMKYNSLCQLTHRLENNLVWFALGKRDREWFRTKVGELIEGLFFSFLTEPNNYTYKPCILFLLFLQQNK